MFPGIHHPLHPRSHDSVILRTPSRAIAATELARTSAGVARALALRGVGRGDRLLWVVRSSLDAALVLFGALGAGVVVVPANAGYQDAELAHVLGDSGAALAVYDDDDEALRRVAGSTPVLSCAALLAEAAALDPQLEDDVALRGADDDLALLVYTSGTTGRSKGCAHTWGGLRAGVGALMQLWGVGPSDVVVNALPLFHVHGLCVALLGALWSGAQTLLLPRFSPEAVVDAVAGGGTVFMSVPTMVHRLLQHLDGHPDDAAVLGRLRLFTCGSAALSADHLALLRARTGLTILERYGMSETLITVSNPLIGERRPGSVGLPVPGFEVRIVEDELQVRGPSLMRGYWNRADADGEVFVEDEAGGARWFRTGDVVANDDDGYLRIVGRASQDILKVGGYKVSAREIEDEVARHPGVAEVAVVGVPDPEWGERVCAVVVPRPGATPTLADVAQTVRLHEAKKPRIVLLSEALPRNAMGKVLKTELKAWAAAQTAAQTAVSKAKAGPTAT